MESDLGYQNQNFLHYCVCKQTPKPELQPHLFTSVHQGCCGEVWEHFIPLSLTAGQKTYPDLSICKYLL